MGIFRGIIFLSLGLCAYGGHTAMAGPQNVLDEARWHNRLVVICSQKDGFRQNAFAADYLENIDRDGFKERDIMLLQILKKPRTGILAILMTPEPHLQLISDPDMVELISEKADCDSGQNSIALIGKDGGLKKIWRGYAPYNDSLFSVIDAMPMRQHEMRDARKQPRR